TRALFDPRVPLMSGVVQNQDSYMKGKIAQRKWYDRVLPTLKAVMDEYSRLTGRKYDVVMPYRLEDAEYAIVGSGCMIETAEAAVTCAPGTILPSSRTCAATVRGRTSLLESNMRVLLRYPSIRTFAPPVHSRCAGIRSAVMVRSRPTKSSRRSPARYSAWTCKPIRNTVRKRKACLPHII